MGKKIIVLTNLKPANIRGIKSEGMLLAADDGKGAVSILTVDRDIAPGSKVR
jgi:tRNA-binding EMAP/Myf-like protein